MKILAISGSGRAASTNTALLRAVSNIAQPDHQVTVFSGVADLPVFTPDLEGSPLPSVVRQYLEMIRNSEGIIISSPEYVRTIPGGLKNAIDWLVSRDEIICKPVALMHASHRGDDMLAQLRLVLSTITQRFSEDLFIRFNLMKLSPTEVTRHFMKPEHRAAIEDFVGRFAQYSERTRGA